MHQGTADLFATLHPALFRPLGDPYARVYFRLLDALHGAKFDGTPLEVPKRVAVTIAEEILRSSDEWSARREELIRSVADEDALEDVEDPQDDEVARATAGRLLRRLVSCGWFRFEYYPEVGEVLNFHAYPARLLTVLRSIARDEQPILSGYANAVASLLDSHRFEMRPGLHLDMAARETIAFSRELRILHGTIQDSLESLAGQDLSVPQIVDETIHRYAERVRKSYNNLKTRENIFGWRAYVMKRLGEISDRPALRANAARELIELQGLNPETAEDAVEERIAMMLGHIDVMPQLVQGIDERNTRYTGLASRRIAYLLRQNDGFDAQLQFLVDKLGEGSLLSLDLPLYRQQHVSSESWYRARRYSPPARQTALLPDEEVDERVVREQMGRVLGKKFRPEKVAQWADELLGDRSSIEIAETRIGDDESYVYLVQLIHYAESAKVPYSVAIADCVVRHCTGCDGCRVRIGRYSFPRGMIVRGGI